MPHRRKGRPEPGTTDRGQGPGGPPRDRDSFVARPRRRLPRQGTRGQGKTSGAWSSVNRLPDCVSSPPVSLLRPPLPEPAVLPVKVLPLTVAVPELSRPPPTLAELPVKVLSITVASPRLKMPPPEPPKRPAGAELPVKVLSITVIVPELSMPPPWPPPREPRAT